MARGQTRGQTLQLGAHGIKFGQLVVVKAGHDQAAPVARQHGLGFQTLQRLAHRRAADPQPLGQFGFDQPVPRFVKPRLDRLEDQRIGILLHRIVPVYR